MGAPSHPRPRRGSLTGATRDRDAEGRPRSARPRDATGRPLPKGTAGPARAGDDYVFGSAGQALDDAQRLITEAHPFEAHEVLEAAWHAAAEAERDLWQGLAQVAVALTHVQRGNARGAVALFRRAADRLRSCAGTTPYDVPVDRVRGDLTRLADEVEARGTEAVDVTVVRLRGT